MELRERQDITAGVRSPGYSDEIFGTLLCCCGSTRNVMIDLQDHLVTVLSGEMSDLPGPEARYWASSMSFQSRPEVMHTRFGPFPSALTIQ